MLVTYLPCLYVLIADRRDTSETVTLFNDQLRIGVLDK